MSNVALQERPRLHDAVLPCSPLPRCRATPHLEALDLSKCRPLLFEEFTALEVGSWRDEQLTTLGPQVELEKKKRNDIRNVVTYNILYNVCYLVSIKKFFKLACCLKGHC